MYYPIVSGICLVALPDPVRQFASILSLLTGSLLVQWFVQLVQVTGGNSKGERRGTLIDMKALPKPDESHPAKIQLTKLKSSMVKVGGSKEVAVAIGLIRVLAKLGGSILSPRRLKL